jgi:hypothetical protein
MRIAAMRELCTKPGRAGVAERHPKPVMREAPMLTRIVRLFLGPLAVIPLLFFAACTDNSPLNPLAGAAGTYQLTLFRGLTPPVTDTYSAGQISSLPNGGTVTWTDGTMVLNGNGTFIETNNYTAIPTGSSTSTPGAFVSSGTYTVRGTAFTLTAPAQNQVGARNAIGTISASTIDYQESNGTSLDSYQYKR